MGIYGYFNIINKNIQKGGDWMRQKEKVRKIMFVGNSFTVTIPREFVEKLGLKKGDIIIADIKGDTLIFKPAKQ